MAGVCYYHASVTASVLVCITLVVVVWRHPMFELFARHTGGADYRDAMLPDGPPGVNGIVETLQLMGMSLLGLDLLDGRVNKSLLHVAVNEIYDWRINSHPNYTSEEYKFRLRCQKNDKPSRHVYVVSHTETISAVDQWYELAFSQKGHYMIDNLNLPPMLPYRDGFPEVFKADEPLSYNGHIHSWLMGHGFQERDLVVSHVYAAPHMAAVETANSFLAGMGITLPINIEPGILGWMKDYTNVTFMNDEEFYWYNITINTQYEPIISLDQLKDDEPRMEEYERSRRVIRRILNNHRDEEGDILIVSELSTTETVSRSMLREDPLDSQKFRRLYAGHPALPPGIMSVLEENCGQPGWHRVRPPIPPYTSRHVKTYNWTFMLL